ncbi:hypothetical protein [Corynebacterium casei]|uniref:hypothetical protein n=1 Tax=Corynebacterium casei TaxID=160386 RepID=UPI003BB77F47
MKKYITLLFSLVFAGICIPIAQADTAPEIGQGAKIVGTNSGSTCTVGFVNWEKSTVFTAGHCAFIDRDWGFSPRDEESDLIPLGNIQTEFDYSDENPDIGIIRLPSGVRPGPNFNIANKMDKSPAVGKSVCAYSRVYDAVSCAEIVEIAGNSVFVSTELRLAPGDSGTALWTEKGIVGLLSGPSYFRATTIPERFRFARIPAEVNPSPRAVELPGDAGKEELEVEQPNSGFKMSSMLSSAGLH